jgi:REP element-mobilizing transposase RayT
MADTYSRVLVHFVFSTKNRLPLISDLDGIWNYLRGIARNRDADVLAVGGTENHVHMLIALPRNLTISTLMRDLKANSSRHLNERHRGFAWQDGYAAISVSPSQVQAVCTYIARQQEHHTKWSFENEYVSLLGKSGVQRSPVYTLG